ncbi:pyruvate decarboxylase [Trichoderma asperellum]|uniref:Pyruvate decarboxylase n=1 Tax=Trichoderma asperellum TaxID=101201 RepID=A0A6V8R585_TRIAP|nr:thiamine diphosphate-binding protein [Trichoderma asperelloides]GFP60231.1 pyruvate decarboxylase [Trichoderma asperellum]
MAPVKLADYLFTRLRQLGVESVHGVPGDFNLTMLDHVEPAGLNWVGNTNELNAAYAADGYSRIKGLGAIVTTFGVGELSAINAIAGAYAEFAPVVHIVGTPARQIQEERTLVHHTLNDGEFKRFSQMHAHVTIAQTRLWDPMTSAEQVDNILLQCLLHCRPVYVELPVDMVDAIVSGDRLQTPILIPEPQPTPNLDDVLLKIISKIEAAKQAVIYVDGESRPLRIVEAVQQFVSMTKWPTLTSPFGKGLMDETEPNFIGVYQGKFGPKAVHDFVTGSDLALCFGPHYSGTNTYMWNSIPQSKETIEFTTSGIKIGSDFYRDVSTRLVLSRLLKELDMSKIASCSSMLDLPRYQLLAPSSIAADDIIKQDKVWKVLGNLIQPGDIVMGETGTPGFGVREMPMQKHCRVFSHVTWLSIGYMLPAAQGAALAQKELIAASKWHNISTAKTILFIGDGSFQMTVQEMSTMIKHNLNVVIVLINNDGYSIERFIHGRKQTYNDVARWRYIEAPSFFGAPKDTYTASAKTWFELHAILERYKLNNAEGLSMFEVVMEREDAPPGQLQKVLEMQIERELKN